MTLRQRLDVVGILHDQSAAVAVDQETVSRGDGGTQQSSAQIVRAGHVAETGNGVDHERRARQPRRYRTVQHRLDRDVMGKIRPQTPIDADDLTQRRELAQRIVTVPVETQPMKRAEMVAVYSGTAPIEAQDEAQVVAKVGGEVRQIYVEEGDFVKEGALLARLDGDRLRLTLAQQDANLKKLERDYKRTLGDAS